MRLNIDEYQVKQRFLAILIHHDSIAKKINFLKLNSLREVKILDKHLEGTTQASCLREIRN